MIVQTKPNGHYHWLDLLRFIAAFMVLFSHSRNDFFLSWNELPADQHNVFSFIFYTLGRLGHEAVVVFFVLSGFLVGGRGLERVGNKSFDVKSYAIDRFSRIYPPLLTAMGLYYVTCLVIPTESWNWSTAIGNLFNLQGICCEPLVGPFWSLSLEVWFYVILAFIGILAATKNSSIKVIGITLITASCSLFVLGFDMHYLLIWFMGAVAYLYRPQKKLNFVLIGSIIGIILFIGLWQVSVDSNSINFPLKLQHTRFIEIGLSLMMCLFVQQVILFEPKGNISMFIESKIGKLACFSYTLYLSHRIILMWIFFFYPYKHQGTMTLIDITIYCWCICLTMFFSWMFYLVSEKHSPYLKLTLKKKIVRISK